MSEREQMKVPKPEEARREIRKLRASTRYEGKDYPPPKESVSGLPKVAREPNDPDDE